MTSTGRECLDLKYVGQPPNHLFSDEPFDIVLVLEKTDSFTQDSRTPEVVELEAELYQADHGMQNFVSQTDQISVSINPSVISLPVSGGDIGKPQTTTIRCRLVCPVHENTPTIYQIKIKESKSSAGTSFNVRSATSKAIQMVNAKLKIEKGDWDSIFYKDEGGRDRGMKVNVGLYDYHDKPIRNRRIPLDLTLIYDPTLIPVDKQGIFRVIGTTEQCALDDDGRTSLDFRIEEVSKNHNNQPFSVRIAAQGAKNAIVAPTTTPSVSVRSKRTKRPRSTLSRGTIAIPPLPQQNPAPNYQGDPMFYQNQSAHRLRLAMRGVVAWTEQVINGLSSLKWGVCGYHEDHRLERGIDFNKPIFSMTNPNDRIAQIINMYTTETWDHLQLLRSTVDETTIDHLDRSHPREDIRAIPPRHQHQDYPSSHFSAYRGGTVNTMMTTQNSHIPLNLAGQEPPPHPHQQHVYPQPMQPMPGEQSNLPQTPNDLSNPSLAMAASHHHQGELEQDQIAEQELDHETSQSDVFYVLAKQYKSIHHNNKAFGCPAFNITKVLLGFYSRSVSPGNHARFAPIHKYYNEFDQNELSQAKSILENAFESESGALYSMKNYGSLTNMVEDALDYYHEVMARRHEADFV